MQCLNLAGNPKLEPYSDTVKKMFHHHVGNESMPLLHNSLPIDIHLCLGRLLCLRSILIGVDKVAWIWQSISLDVRLAIRAVQAAVAGLNHCLNGITCCDGWPPFVCCADAMGTCPEL
jgi:hypothetical protein